MMQIKENKLKTSQGISITLPLDAHIAVAMELPERYRQPGAPALSLAETISGDYLRGSLDGRLLVGTVDCCKGNAFEYIASNGKLTDVYGSPINVFDMLPVIFNQSQRVGKYKHMGVLTIGYGCAGRGVFLHNGDSYIRIADRETTQYNNNPTFVVGDGKIQSASLDVDACTRSGDYLWYNQAAPRATRLNHDLTQRLVAEGVDIAETIAYAADVNKVRKVGYR